MVKKLLGTMAMAGALTSIAAVPATADPEPTPPPYCAGNDPGDQLNGVTCDEQLSTAGETPDPRPSDPPPGGNWPGGGGPGDGGGPGGDGPGGGGPGGSGPGGDGAQ